MKNIYINISGVVGVGKSSLCDILKSYDFNCFKEPVLENKILESFYKDKKKYALASQLFFLNARLKMIKKAEKLNFSVIDRGMHEDMLFAKNLFLRQELSPEEFEIYQQIYENYNNLIKKPDLVIYLKVSPENAIKRIKQRDRSFENLKDISYWHNLNQQYENFFKSFDQSRLLEIDVNDVDFVNSMNDQHFILGKIFSKVNSLSRSHNGMGSHLKTFKLIDELTKK